MSTSRSGPAISASIPIRSNSNDVSIPGRSQKSEVRSQKSEVRSQKSEVRSQKSEVRSQESEVRSQESEWMPVACLAGGGAVGHEKEPEAGEEVWQYLHLARVRNAGRLLNPDAPLAAIADEI